MGVHYSRVGSTSVAVRTANELLTGRSEIYCNVLLNYVRVGYVKTALTINHDASYEYTVRRSGSRRQPQGIANN